MKISPEHIIIGVNLLVFVLAPFLPNFIYDYFVDTYLGIAILMIVALYQASFGYLSLLSSFIGISSLYAESHARKVKKIKRDGTVNKEGNYVKQLESAPPLMDTEVHPDIPEPENENVTFLPKDDDESNAFKPVDTTINTKTPLTTTSLPIDAEKVFVSKNLAEKLD
jgi:hypothetical protein